MRQYKKLKDNWPYKIFIKINGAVIAEQVAKMTCNNIKLIVIYTIVSNAISLEL